MSQLLLVHNQPGENPLLEKGESPNGQPFVVSVGQSNKQYIHKETQPDHKSVTMEHSLWWCIGKCQNERNNHVTTFHKLIEINHVTSWLLPTPISSSLDSVWGTHKPWGKKSLLGRSQSEDEAVLFTMMFWWSSVDGLFITRNDPCS